jgi:NADPH:quinone reductase-like Zn-dependent oxidoreductase
MRVQKYTSTKGVLEKHLELYTSQPLPKLSPHQHLLKVLAVGPNPVDFKPVETTNIGWPVAKKPATPGFDIAGRIITPADGSTLEPGQLVFGAVSTNPLTGSALVEYFTSPTETICAGPAGISPLILAGAPIAPVTAHASLIPYIRPCSCVFTNGGSNGVGTYAIQNTKIASAHVTVSCSTANLELCRSLGADEVLDYTQRPLLEQLREARPFEHVVDNVSSDPALYFQAHTYMSADATLVEVAGGPTTEFLRFAPGALLWPTVLGGGRRKFALACRDINCEVLGQIGR